jgi:histone acetyltransferase MYST1
VDNDTPQDAQQQQHQNQNFHAGSQKAPPRRATHKQTTQQQPTQHVSPPIQADTISLSSPLCPVFSLYSVTREATTGAFIEKMTASPTNNSNSGTTPAIAPLQIHDTCQVRWRGGVQNLQAIVLERRCVNKVVGSNKTKTTAIKEEEDTTDRDASSTTTAKKRKRHQTNTNTTTDQEEDTDTTTDTQIMEYYVHYVNHDRRLDEWITMDKIVPQSIVRRQQQNTNESQPQQQPAIENEQDNNDDDDANSNPSSQGQEQEPQDDNDMVVNNLLSGGNWHGGTSSSSSHNKDKDPTLVALERDHEETTKIKNIERIIMGQWEVEAWYYSPFPAPYSGIRTLFVCEYCLSYMKKVRTYRAHKCTCTHRKPPGTEIYLDKQEQIAVYELDGKDHRAYCQKLCLLAKLFLDHKTLYYDVTPFMFYVVTKVDVHGSHIVGYFSKEKVSSEGYNLACILTFPQYQKSGYGKFIISLSYEITKREGKTGSPEKPLSDLGKVSYRSYWTHVLMNILSAHDTTQSTVEDISIQDISTRTGIRTEDIISTLQSLDMIRVWKGQHVVYVEQAKLKAYMAQKYVLLCFVCVLVILVLLVVLLFLLFSKHLTQACLS